MDLAGFVKLRLLDTRSQASIDLREASRDRAGQAVQRNARQTLAWADAMLQVVHDANRIGLPDPATSKELDPQEQAYQDILTAVAGVWSDHPDHGTWPQR